MFIFLAHTIYATFLLWMKPYKLRNIQILKSVSEILFIVATFLMISFPTFGDLYSVMMYKIVGWFVTIIFYFTLCVEMFSLLI